MKSLKKPRIAFLGDLTLDTYVNEDEFRFGGAVLNCTVWANRSGAIATPVTAVGSDPAGDQFLKKLKGLGIQTAHVQRLPGVTSSIEIYVEKSGERRYGTWDPGTLADYHLTPENIDFLKTQDAVSVTIYPQFVHLLQELRAVKLLGAYKPFIVINYGDLGEFKKNSDVVFTYEDLADAFVFSLDKQTDKQYINSFRKIAVAHTKLVIVTLGQYGSVAYEGANVFAQEAKNVRIRDTTGAGDAFLAGFLVTYLKARDIPSSLSAGTQLAAKAIRKLGAY